MTKEIRISPLPIQLKDGTFIFEKNVSAAQKNDCNAIKRCICPELYVHCMQAYAQILWEISNWKSQK